MKTIAPTIACSLFLLYSRVEASSVSCTTTEQCEEIILPGSECVNGKCSNPYLKGGCLARRLEGWNRIRVCNSEDEPDAAEKGHCRTPNPGFDYLELRIFGQNWESSFFNVWIIQILLSEILGVPVTLETGVEGKKLGFYDAESRMDYGTSYDWDALRRANEIGDCRLLDRTNPALGYQSCAHFIPEIWYGYQNILDRMFAEGIIEREHSIGTLGQQGLFIPRRTAMHDPSLLTYLGLSGSTTNATAARHKLAELFKRPTTWGDYCREVSENQCESDDGVAKRAPLDNEEANRFHSLTYMGHFRHTEENDCKKFPDTCTGHFVDYPCGWTSYAKQQFHHNGIALKSNGQNPGSNGYTYSEMIDIWTAADVTQSHVMLQWWWPEALYQTFLDTDSEFQRISFPPPTLSCVKKRVDSVTRCSGETEQERLGEKIGSCDEPPYALRRVVVQKLAELTYDPSVPEELRNPGYDAVKNIQIDGLHIGQIFDYWLKRGSDKWNFDPRDATCRWIAENFDLVRTWVPDSYPRVTKENENYYKESLFYVSVAFALLAIASTTLAAGGVYYKRKEKSMIYAQVPFLCILLAGMASVNVGSLLLIAPPTNARCLLVVWLTNLGYTLELMPLIVKINAINNLLNAAKSMKRKVLKRKKLYGEVFGVAFLVAIFLTIWCVVDPSLKSSQYDLTADLTDNEETIVRVSHFCNSNSQLWQYLGAGWHGLMLVAATAMAFQTRKLEGEFNESMILGILIYSHFAFVVWRMLLFFFEGNLSIWNVSRYLSIIFSADSIATCCIYFFPKILSDDAEERIANFKISGLLAPIRRSSLFRRASTEGTVSPTPPTSQNLTSSATVGWPVTEWSNYSESHSMPILEEDLEEEEESTDFDNPDPLVRDGLDSIEPPNWYGGEGLDSPAEHSPECNRQ